MFEFLSPAVLQDPVVLLLGVAALSMGGALVLEMVLRIRRRVRDTRVALIAPWTQTASAAPAQTLPGSSMRDPELTPTERAFGRFLSKVGLPLRLAPTLFFAAKPLSASCLCVAFWFLAPLLLSAAAAIPLRMLLAGSAGLLGWFLPVFVAQGAVARRTTAVVSGLPDALELLVICSEGGLALADGIDRIVVELKRSQPELAEELATTAADLKILPTQDQALSRLAVRIDAPIMRSVVTSLTQTMRYGTPLAQALRVVAAELRNEALIKMEERVNRLPALLTIPMIVFILPTILLIAGGPAALKTIDIMTH